MILVALSSGSTIVFHPCSAMGRGKQWSADTVREVKTLMNIGLPLPRTAAQTGVVLQTDTAQLQCPLEKKGLHGRQARQSSWCAPEADRRDEALDL